MTRVFLWKLTTGLSLCVLTASMLRKNGSTLHPTCEENVRLSGKDLDLENEYLIYTHINTYHKLWVWVWAPCEGGILDKATRLWRGEWENKIIKNVCGTETCVKVLKVEKMQRLSLDFCTCRFV